MERTKQKALRRLSWLLGAAFVLRVVLLCITPAYGYDQNCFFAWAGRMADVGAREFYAPEYFADYPPGYMLVLGVVGKLLNLLNLTMSQKGGVLLMALPPVLCDLGLTVLIWHIGMRYLDPKRAQWMAAFAALCPALLYDTAVWKQVDGVLCLCMVGVFYLLEQKKYLPSALLYGVALSLKPQALLLGPVLALCFLQPLLPPKGERLTGKRVLDTAVQGVLGVLLALLPVVLAALPFVGFVQAPAFLLEKYFATTQSYTYASVNAFNLFGAMGANWAQQTDPAGFLSFLSWQSLGTLMLVLVTLFTVWLAVVSTYKGSFSPLLLSAFYSIGVFTLGHRMHERYLLLGLLLLIAACARWADRRMMGTAAAFSLTALLNQAMVYCQTGTEDEFLNSPLSQLMIRVVSIGQVIAFAVLAAAVYDLLVGQRQREFVPAVHPAAPEAPRPQPKWSRPEAVGLALLTLLTALISFVDLGEMKAPQTVLDARYEPVSGTVQVEGEAQELWVYSCISNDGALVVTDDTGGELGRLDLGHTNTFNWKTISVPAMANYHISIEQGSILELAFKDANGNVLPVQGSAELDAALDEQELIPESISYRNSMYFDEIYHGRTAYEQLHKMPIYETTHPPLGKVFIMLGIALFGMTGFGWRCAGVAFGVAMVPVLYLLARRLTRSPKLAGLAAVLFALDGMRLSQSRIATIDVYGTFFILLGAYFMVWYCQSVLERGVLKSILPMALCGISFGLGAASKWTGIYAGAGLAVLYFGVLWARWKQRKSGFDREFTAAILGGFTFFVLIPLVIYYASYFVYFWQDPNFGFSGWWNNQMYMLSYHQDLKATHTFESRWYTWPLALRPVWYYIRSGLPQGYYSCISGMGNPIVWWAGTAAVLWMFWQQASGRSTREGGAVTVLYLTQLLPWVLVTRCTFLYHYFPSLGFSILALILLIHALSKRVKPRTVTVVSVGLVILAAAALVWLLPALTGMTVPIGWAESTCLLPSWDLYPL